MEVVYRLSKMTGMSIYLSEILIIVDSWLPVDIRG